MKKNKKGFTLVELLAVIVILGIIVAIAAPNLLNARKAANIEEAKKMEQMIEELGSTIYTYEKLKNPTGAFMTSYMSSSSFKINSTDLKSNGYLSSNQIKNPSGSGVCTIYLIVYPPSDNFKGYVDCPGIYKTSGINPGSISDLSF